ncbi:unnamed protein product [Ostreobium quekettii]|uniref:Uncharacterized protein n=1 Tax=Ostreobium quekettii TaxID=121088 RepID=A0A8S1IQ43_9CHLO|nr:unnamed protein product [Ostreobium quekettii]
MVPGAEPRGYGLTASDMEASRLVFVSVKGSQQRRKAAVPVPDGYTWAQFCDQVKLKLKLNNIKAIYLASSGEKIASLDGLEDIDDLFVEEGLASPTNGMNSTSPLATEAALREGETSTSEFQYAASAGAQQPVTVHRAQVCLHILVLFGKNMVHTTMLFHCWQVFESSIWI